MADEGWNSTTLTEFPPCSVEIIGPTLTLGVGSSGSVTTGVLGSVPSATERLVRVVVLAM